MAPLQGDGQGIRTRNFSRIRGYLMYEYEHYYRGSYHADVVTSVSVHLNVLSSTLDSYQQYKPSIFKSIPVDCTFELYSLMKVFYSLEDLQRSIYVDFSDESEDFLELFESSDLVQHLLKILKTSNLQLEGFYCDFTHSAIDGRYDHFDLHLIFG